MILALDPGRDKVGLALVSSQGEVRRLEILARDEVGDEVRKILDSGDVSTLVLGNGTFSRELARELAAVIPGEVELGLVEEEGSTREARKLYRRDNPGSQLKKLLLQIMDWQPALPIDHYAALVLAGRYLQSGFLEKVEH